MNFQNHNQNYQPQAKKPQDFYPQMAANQTLTSGLGSVFKNNIVNATYSQFGMKVTKAQTDEEEDDGYQTPPGMEDEQLEDLDDKI